MGGSKLTRIQREDAKIYVRECVISKFSREESLAYVKQKLGRQDITIFDIYRIKVALKKDTAKWMNSLMKDRWAYVAEYKERVDEYYKYQKEYWRIFHLNPTIPYLQKITLNSLQNVSAALTQLYDIMPEIAGGHFTDVKTTEETAPKATTPTKAKRPKATPWTADSQHT